MIDSVKVGKIISVCRREKGLTQDELSSILGVTPQAVSKWERGGSLPDIDFLPHISNIFNISIDNILSGEIPKNDSNEKQYKPKDIYDVKSLILPDEIKIEIAVNLAVNNDRFIQNTVDGLGKLRRKIALEKGIILPPIRLRDITDIDDNEYCIFLRSTHVGKWHVYKDMIFTLDEKACGLEDTDALGNKIVWVSDSESEIETELSNNNNYFNGSMIILAHLEKIVSENLISFVTPDSVRNLTDIAALRYPTLVSGLIPQMLSYSKLAKIIKIIIAEGKSVRDMLTILETIDELIDETSCDVNTLAKKIMEKL